MSAPTATMKKAYVPPSLRKAVKKELTAIDIQDADLFPTLGGAKNQVPAPSKIPEISMKARIEQRMREEEEQAAFEMQRDTSDINQMTQKELEANGWGILRLPKTKAEYTSLLARIHTHLEQERVWTEKETAFVNPRASRLEERLLARRLAEDLAAGDAEIESDREEEDHASVISVTDDE